MWTEIKKPNSARKKLVLASLGLICFGLFLFSEAENTELKKVRSSTATLRQTSSLVFTPGGFMVDTSFIVKNVNKRIYIEELNRDSLKEFQQADSIPAFIMDFMRRVSPGGQFDLASPGQEWQSGSGPVLELVFTQRNQFQLASKVLPLRQLIYFGLGKDIAVLAYVKGGKRIREDISIFKFVGTKITDYYFANHDSPLRRKKEIINFLKRTAHPQWQAGC